MRGKPDSPGYMIAGDVMRGVLMCLVMLYHAAAGAAPNLGPEQAADPITAFEPLGELIFRMDLVIWPFFALSGYLVGGPFVRAWVEGTRWPDVRRYLSRRARRILPAFWLTVIALYLIYDTRGASREQMIETIFFAQAFDPSQFEQVFVQGWTVGVEVCFYVALPLVALLITRFAAGLGTRESRLRWLVGVLVAVSAASLFLRMGADPYGSVGRSLVGCLWAFVPGLLLAAYETDFRARLAGTARGRAVGLGFVALGVVTFAVSWATLEQTGTWAGDLLTIGFTFGLLGGLLTCQWAWGGLPRIFDTRAGHALGRWSFGFYLFHVAIVRELCLRLPDGISNLGAVAFVASITLVVGLGLAALSWWLIEEPFMEKRPPRWPRRSPPDAPQPPRPPVEDPAVAKIPA